jgi:parallel beta-helix repeat protein
VSNADISGATRYGVVNNGQNVSVTNSTIENIGDHPFDGMQYGVGIFYTGGTGTISGNHVGPYQKGGITVRDSGSATIQNNTVSGSGPVNYIAQNGIQISYGASATVTGNTVTGNWYTPATWTACGLLFYQAGGVKQSANTLSANQTNLCNVGRGGGNVKP